MNMQIHNTGSMIEACLVISEEHHDELIKAFGARLRNLIIEAENIATKQGMTYEEANQAYWTSNEKRGGLVPDLRRSIDTITKCQRAKDSLLRVVKANVDGGDEG